MDVHACGKVESNFRNIRCRGCLLFYHDACKAQSMSCAEVPQIATDTFILGCPLTATGMALLQTGNVAKAGDPRAPLNPLVNLTRFGAPSVGD
jgi:hypothetical protein